MANGGVQVFACILAFVGLVCLITSTCVNEWKTYGYSNEGIVKSLKEYVGLWMECTVHGPRQLECTVYDTLDSVLYQRGEVQWTRAMMILSIILSVCGLAVAMLGMKCTLCLDADKQVKNKVALGGGILLILSGVCALGIVSWYANDVIANFHNPKPEEKRYSLGRCLFVGWGGALLSLIGGALLACCSLSRSTSRRSYTSSPPQLPMTSDKEYV
ncbi:claudin-7-A-like [Sardina pilchardus]|uniref:claudin-7-A-like n=1 Tax=Sardina pilchardus TaxID=27697 RepID=UPI002E0DE7B5